ncbi:MAG: UvrB/UvrC motif-containing protein [candidate division Zixibacteria bacterium]|nr:UvrB/UvrC motif-containing protein [candidate division Zixibacteria bacterium]
MLCDDCKNNNATIQVTQIINNDKMTLNLCQKCAEKRGFRSPFEGVPFPLAEFLSSMITASAKTGDKPHTKTVIETRCPGCGMSFTEFAQKGRLGCGGCYKAFRPQLKDLLRKIHGSDSHRGKIPNLPGKEMTHLREERKLQEELKKAIEEENFEMAARIRDKIKGLQTEK